MENILKAKIAEEICRNDNMAKAMKAFIQINDKPFV